VWNKVSLAGYMPILNKSQKPKSAMSDLAPFGED
jgi:hypothetical protein